MKRDMDLVRRILLEIEAHKHGFAPSRLVFDGCDDEVVAYHVHLMGQARLLNVKTYGSSSTKSPSAIPISMTWEGHEFLDAARPESIWNQAKERVGAELASVPFEVFKALLLALAAESLGL